MKRRVLALVAIFTCVCNVYGQDIAERKPGLWVTRELKLQLPVVREKSLVIRSALTLSGTIHISTWKQRGIGVVYTKQSKTQGRERAFDHIDLIAVSLDSVGGAGRLVFRAPNPPPWDNKHEFGIVEAHIQVPESSMIELETQLFDVVANGPLRAVEAASSLGAISLSNVSQKVDVSTSNGRIQLRNISGEIHVATSNTTIEAHQIRATEGQASFRNETGDILISDFVGSLNVRNNFGTIDISDFRPTGETNYIRNISGRVKLEIAELAQSRVVVDNRTEDIELFLPESLSAFISLSVDDEGVIDVGSFPFRTDLIQRNRLNLVAGEAGSDINATVKGKGRILVRSRAPIEGRQ